MKTKFKYLFLAIITTFCSIFVYSQKNDSKQSSPDIKIDVNKEYDENGNIIKYDSIYSYSYSGESSITDADSLFNNFNFSFDHFFDGFNYNLYPGLQVDTTDELNVPDSGYYAYDPGYFNDSIISKFFRDDFYGFGDKDFEKLFRKQMKDHARMMEEFFQNFDQPEAPEFPFNDSIPESGTKPNPRKLSFQNESDVIEL